MIPITCNAVGDILALASLVIDVAHALNDTRGSSSEYRSFINELNGVHAMLLSAARIAEDSSNGVLRDQVIRTVDQCGNDIQQALARIAKFSTLDRDGVHGAGLRVKLKRNWYKVEWRFLQRDEAQTFRKELAMATQRLTTLLVISEADGAVRFRSNMLRQIDASVARDVTLLRAINAGNAAIVNKLDAAPRRGHALVQELSDAVPTGVDSKTAAIAVLCAAVCAMHAPYDRTVPTALLLIAIYILSQSSGQHGRALVQGVAYSSTNAVTLLDALGRRLILPFELCETRDMFHATLVTLFSRMRGRWLIDNHRYSVKFPRRKGDFVLPPDRGLDWTRVRPGTYLEMSVVISQRDMSSCPRCGSQKVPSRGDTCQSCGVRVTIAVRSRGVAGSDEPLDVGARDVSTDVQNFVDDRGIFPVFRPKPLSDAKGMSPGFDGASVPCGTTTANPEPPDESNRPHVPLDWLEQLQEFSRIELSDRVTVLSGDLEIDDSYDVPIQDHRGFLAAIDNGHYPLVVALLDEGVDVNARSQSGLTALHIASLNGYSGIVGLLLDCGAMIDASTEDNYTPLALAVMSSRIDTTSLLLARGAIVDAPQHLRDVVLYVAAGCGNIDVVKLVLRYGADVNVHLGNHSNQTALHAAVLSLSNPTIELLVRNGADVTARSEHGNCNTPLSLAAREGNEHAFELFLSQTSIDRLRLAESQQPWPSDLLFQAMQGQSLKILDTLVQTGLSDVNARFQDGMTPLSLASEGGRDELTELLLSLGADPNAEALPSRYTTLKQGSCRPLHVAAHVGHVRIVEMLLHHGADVNARTEYGDTALSLTLKEKSKHLTNRRYSSRFDEVLNELLSWGAATDERSSSLLAEIAYLDGSTNGYSGVVVPGAWCEDIEQDPCLNLNVRTASD